MATVEVLAEWAEAAASATLVPVAVRKTAALTGVAVNKVATVDVLAE